MPLPSARANEEDRPSEEKFSLQVQSGQDECCQEKRGEKSSGEEGCKEHGQGHSEIIEQARC